MQFCCSEIITNTILRESMRLIITNGRSIAQNKPKRYIFNNDVAIVYYIKHLSCLKLALNTNTISLQWRKCGNPVCNTQRFYQHPITAKGNTRV